MSFILLGILNSQVAGGAAGIAAYDYLTGADGSGTTLSFSSLVSSYSADYDHLEIRANLRQASTIIHASYEMYFNNVNTGTDYSWHYVAGNASSLFQGSTTATNLITSGINAVHGNGVTGAVGATRILILDAFNTNKRTSVQMYHGINEANDRLAFQSAMYNTNDAIDTISLRVNGVTSWESTSRFSLYGIKVA